MIDRTDIQARLRLFRYGLVVVVIVTFLVSLLAPLAALSGAQNVGVDVPPVTDFLGTALLFAVGVAIVALIAYAVYHYFLTKTWPMMGNKS